MEIVVFQTSTTPTPPNILSTCKSFLPVCVCTNCADGSCQLLQESQPDRFLLDVSWTPLLYTGAGITTTVQLAEYYSSTVFPNVTATFSAFHQAVQSSSFSTLLIPNGGVSFDPTSVLTPYISTLIDTSTVTVVGDGFQVAAVILPFQSTFTTKLLQAWDSFQNDALTSIGNGTITNLQADLFSAIVYSIPKTTHAIEESYPNESPSLMLQRYFASVLANASIPIVRKSELPMYIVVCVLFLYVACSFFLQKNLK